MYKCFLCGAEYDKSARSGVINMLNLETNTIVSISDVRKTTDGAPMKLCPNCVRACVFGHELFGSSNYKPIVNVEYEVEATDVNEELPIDSDLKVDGVEVIDNG